METPVGCMAFVMNSDVRCSIVESQGGDLEELQGKTGLRFASDLVVNS